MPMRGRERHRLQKVQRRKRKEVSVKRKRRRESMMVELTRRYHVVVVGEVAVLLPCHYLAGSLCLMVVRWRN